MTAATSRKEPSCAMAKSLPYHGNTPALPRQREQLSMTAVPDPASVQGRPSRRRQSSQQQSGSVSSAPRT